MELRHLRYFIAVAEELNLRRAAERLNVSHPPLSRQIGDLEHEIGVRLLTRGQHGLVLTEPGRVFLDEARQIVGQSRAAVERARAAGRGEAGRLRLAYSLGYFEPSLAAVMNRFRQRYPDVQVEIQQLAPPQQVEALRHGLIDLGYVGLRFARAGAELVFECVRIGSLHVALPPDHPLCARQHVAVASLADQPFVALKDEFPRYRAWLVGQCERAGFTPWIAHQADGAASLFGLVSAGFGVALLPDLHDPPACAVAFRPLDPDPPKVEFNVAWHRDNAAPTLARFLDLQRAATDPASRSGAGSVALFY